MQSHVLPTTDCMLSDSVYDTYSGDTIPTCLRPPFAHLATLAWFSYTNRILIQGPIGAPVLALARSTMPPVVVQVMLGEHRHALLQAEGRTPLASKAVHLRHPVAHMRARRPQAGRVVSLRRVSWPPSAFPRDAPLPYPWPSALGCGSDVFRAGSHEQTGILRCNWVPGHLRGGVQELNRAAARNLHRLLGRLAALRRSMESASSLRLPYISLGRGFARRPVVFLRLAPDDVLDRPQKMPATYALPPLHSAGSMAIVAMARDAVEEGVPSPGQIATTVFNHSPPPVLLGGLMALL